MPVKKIVFIILGSVCLALGCVGIALPILPTVPFFLLTLYFYSRSSERLHDWFIGTKLYKKHLESYVKKEGMTLKTKLTIIGTVTALMAFGLYMMRQVPIGQICLGVVWIFHLIYFLGFVKAKKEEHYASDNA